jgi:hypothetical protein
MLKHGLHHRSWFFDMEWVPDAAAARRLMDVPAEASEAEAIQHLWNYTGATEENPRPFVKYLFSRVVSIAFLSRNLISEGMEKRPEFALHTLPKSADEPTAKDEASIISRFLHFVGERGPQLVGFNSVASDLKVLAQRGMANDITAPEFSRRPEKPWEGRDYFSDFDEWHLDIMKLLGGFREAPKLDELAKTCGFPGKLDMDGQHVVDLWLAGDLEKIIAYNEIDVLNTYLVWTRLARFCGMFNDAEYEKELAAFREFLSNEGEKAGRDHIKAFSEKWQPSS